ncbi:MAG: hypothetical protein FWF22_03670 [Treponema sp.]|nr:hypothetical protein [Treponema sp.]
MFCKRLGLALLIGGLAIAPVSASMVSFLIIEEGLQPGSDSGNYSTLWEGGLMGAFFDAGHIVSNSPVLRVEKMTPADPSAAPSALPSAIPAEAAADFAEANTGGADYFILAVLEYSLQDKRM